MGSGMSDVRIYPNGDAVRREVAQAITERIYLVLAVTDRFSLPLA